MARIGYLVSQYPAPSHTFIRREVEALRRRGLDIQTFSVRSPHPTARLGDADREEKARTWYILPAPKGPLLSAHLWAFARRPRRYLATLREAIGHRTPGVRAWVWALFYFVESIYLARELCHRGIEHLHNHFGNGGATVGMLACRYLGLGWSLTLHGTSEFDFPAGLTLGKKLRVARFASSVSLFGMAQAMRTADPQDWDKLIIVRCGVDHRTLPRVRPRAPGPSRIVCVGRLSPEKGYLGLIEAFSKVLARGKNAELHIVGDGPDRGRIEALIAARGLQDRCVLLGQLPEAEALAEVALADLVVSASFMEGLPVVLMESLALGIPVVAPRVAGIPELVEDRSTGLLYAPADWSALESCICRLLDDPDLRRKLGQAGRERVLAEFDADRATEPLYRRLLAECNVPIEQEPDRIAQAG